LQTNSHIGMDSLMWFYILLTVSPIIGMSSDMEMKFGMKYVKAFLPVDKSKNMDLWMSDQFVHGRKREYEAGNL